MSMEQFTAFAQNAWEQIKIISINIATQVQLIGQNLASKVTPTQCFWVIGILVVILVVLAILLIVRTRKYNDAVDQIDAQVDAVMKAKHDARDQIEKRQKELQDQQDQALERIARRDRENAALIQEREKAFADKNAEFYRLRQFYDQYKGIEDAKVEIRRLLREADEYCDEMKSRVDLNCAELLSRAQEDAQAVRDVSNALLNHARETINKAQERASAIVDGAKAEAGLPMTKIPDSVREALDDAKARGTMDS